MSYKNKKCEYMKNRILLKKYPYFAQGTLCKPFLFFFYSLSAICSYDLENPFKSHEQMYYKKYKF